MASKLDKLVDSAYEHLEPQERIKAAVLGSYETTRLGTETLRNGILIATDRRVVFYSKRLTGYELESFPYSNISSFDQGKNFMGHTITFYASGNKVNVKWIANQIDALVLLTETVKKGMNSRVSTSNSLANSDDIMEKLKKLGELRAAGVLTETEFESKKRELLSRL
jgi:hypothetical protein